jgi:hypothetical protein
MQNVKRTITLRIALAKQASSVMLGMTNGDVNLLNVQRTTTAPTKKYAIYTDAGLLVSRTILADKMQFALLNITIQFVVVNQVTRETRQWDVTRLIIAQLYPAVLVHFVKTPVELSNATANLAPSEIRTTAGVKHQESVLPTMTVLSQLNASMKIIYLSVSMCVLACNVDQMLNASLKIMLAFAIAAQITKETQMT